MFENRLPPYSLDAEEGVNGSILVDSDIIRGIKYLRPDDFFTDVNRIIYEACLNLFNRNQPTDEITVAEELQRTGKLANISGTSYLLHLISITPTSLDAPAYARIVHRDSIARSLISAASQIASIGYEADVDIDGALKHAGELLESVKRGANVNKLDIITPEQMGSAMLDLLEHGEERVSWGFRDLDALTTGISSQDYIIFGSRPSVGKTQLMLEIAEYMGRRKKKVLFVSNEMPMNPVIERYISRTLKMSVREFRQRNISQLDSDTEQRFVEASGTLATIPVYYLFGRCSSDSIWDNARKMQERQGLDAIFVDYLQLLSDCNRGHENHSVAVGLVSHNLKAMGQELNVPVIVASQLNRLVEYREDKRPMLADLRESGEIEQDADVVFLLHRPELHPNDDGLVPEEDRGVLELIMAKNRQLGTADHVIKLQWDSEAYRYGDRE